MLVIMLATIAKIEWANGLLDCFLMFRAKKQYTILYALNELNLKRSAKQNWKATDSRKDFRIGTEIIMTERISKSESQIYLDDLLFWKKLR